MRHQFLGQPVTPAPTAVCAWQLGDLTSTQWWWRDIELGGTASPAALTGYLAGSTPWPTGEHDFVAQALSERLWEQDIPSLAPNRCLEQHFQPSS